MVVYDVSSIVSKNENVSDGKLLPRCLKKRHDHNFFFGPKQIARPPNHVRRPGYSFQAPKIDILGVTFFCDTTSPPKFSLQIWPDFDSLKTPNLKKKPQL